MVGMHAETPSDAVVPDRCIDGEIATKIVDPAFACCFCRLLLALPTLPTELGEACEMNHYVFIGSAKESG